MEHTPRSDTPLEAPAALVAAVGALLVFFVAIALTALPGGRPTASVTVLVLVAVVVGVGGVGGTGYDHVNCSSTSATNAATLSPTNDSATTGAA